jgi:hypothetical protein
MSNEAKARATAGLAAVITGVLLIGTTGLTLVLGWATWAVGLAVLLAAIPSAGEKGSGGRGGGRRGRETRAARFSLVR